MYCMFCSTYQESTTRKNGERFCFQQRKMMDKDDQACDQFVLGTNFWCPESNCCMDVYMCIGRQNRGNEDCPKCRLRAKVVDVKRFNGRLLQKKSRILAEDPSPAPRKLIKRK